jgi:heme-degrading monooxygenase HmoA
MTYILVNHKVEDYSKWKSTFDNFADVRKSSGEKSFQIMHPSDDANDLTLLFEWDTRQNAEKFLNSNELKNAMQQGGVAGEPKIQFLNQVAHGAL